ncbi:EF-hand domain-containing protein [Phenylobacterium sp. SCN 70-31]|uniref:EF-hand domain-containing protein n=1 Tax=Phenylobacterium sp. SCN 70-31 TaxID=1660129 RepID=UPI0025F4A7DD|nr:EF-hand domain-containing protein [Phenylobacterium sp. SCN 70-31]
MRKTTFTILAAAAVAAAPMAALAQMPTPADLVKNWDKDGDGAISKAEWVAAGRPAERFDAVDTNKDGKVTVAELDAAMNALRQRGG